MKRVGRTSCPVMVTRDCPTPNDNNMNPLQKARAHLLSNVIPGELQPITQKNLFRVLQYVCDMDDADAFATISRCSDIPEDILTLEFYCDLVKLYRAAHPVTSTGGGWCFPCLPSVRSRQASMF